MRYSLPVLSVTQAPCHQVRQPQLTPVKANGS